MNNFNLFCKMLLMMMLLMLMSSMVLLMKSKSIILELNIFSYISTNIPMNFTFDSYNTMFLSVIFWISSMVMLFSMDYMKGDNKEVEFSWLVLMFVISMSLMVLSSNLLFILLGWDGLGLTSYCLILHYKNVEASQGSFVTLMTNRLGDLGILFSIILMWGLEFNFYSMNMEFYQVYMLILLAAMTKSAQFPFNVWLPMAMAAPTPVSALVHSSTLVTAGVFLLFRFSYLLTLNSHLLMKVSLITIVWSSSMALMEMDLKKIIALSTLSQLGFMMFSMSQSLWNLTFFHLLTHAMFKSLMFLSSGNFIHSLNYQQVNKGGSIDSSNPISTTGLIISSLCLSGMPFLSGFYSKDVLIENILAKEMNMLILPMFMVGIMLSSIYSFRLVKLVVWLSWNGYNYYEVYEESKSSTAIVGLILLSIVGGSFVSWLIWTDIKLVIMEFPQKLFLLMMMLLGFWIVWFIDGNLSNQNVLYVMNMVEMNQLTMDFLNIMYWMSFWHYTENSWMESVSGKGGIHFTIFMSNKSMIYQNSMLLKFLWFVPLITLYMLFI